MIRFLRAAPAGRRARAGFTLLEVLVAGVIMSVAAAGTMASLVAAARMVRQQNNTGTAEAAWYAQETAERFRNMMACDSAWFNPANCNPAGPMPVGWTADPLPAPAGGPADQSILDAPARRCYRVTPTDFGGAAGNDYYRLDVRMCWNNDLVNCPC